MNAFSLNNKLVLEPYKEERTLRAEERNGFAVLSQKVKLKGLKLLVDAHLNNGTVLKRDSIVYIKEELLFTQQWAKQIFDNTDLNTSFILVDSQYIDFIIPPKND